MKKAENKPEDFIIPENSIDEKAETSEVEMNDEVLENISIADMMAQIDEKIAELDRMEKENEQEEEKIFASIKKVLEENQLEYSFHSESVKRIEILFVTENKPYSMQILFQNEKVVLRLVFPYRVQCNSLALVALYVAEFNQDKAFTLVNLNMSTGELSMEYAYYLSKAEKFDAESFEIYMNALLLLSNDIYTKLSHLAVGKVSKEIREYYKTLLEMSLTVLNEKEDENRIVYGSETLRKNVSRHKNQFLKRIASLPLWQGKRDGDISCYDEIRKRYEERRLIPLDDEEEDFEEKISDKEEIIMPFEGVGAYSENEEE